MKQQWEMCTVQEYIRLDEKQRKLLEMGAFEIMQFGEKYFMPKYYTSNSSSEMEFSNQDDAVEYLLQDGWEPFSVMTNKDEHRIYYFRRKVE